MSADRESPAAVRRRAKAYADETARRAARLADAFAAFQAPPPPPPPAEETPSAKKKAKERSTAKRKR